MPDTLRQCLDIARTMPWHLMAAPKKAVDSEQFSITLNKQTLDLLEKLVEIGLHGNNRGEVVRTLVSSQLEELVVRGVLSLGK